MTALVSFERVFEVLDLPSIVHEKPDAVVLPGERAGRVRPRSFRYPRADEVSLASLETVARTGPRQRGGPPRRLVHGRAGPDGGAGRTLRRRQDHDHPPDRPAVRRRLRGGPGRRVDVRDLTLDSLEDAVGYVTQDAHMFHDTIRANLLYARPAADDGDLGGRSRRPRSPVWSRLSRRSRHRGRRPGLPALRRRAAAAGDRAAPAEVAGDRGARRGHRPPRLRVRGRGAAGARRRPRGPHLRGDRPPALHRAQRRPDPGRRRRPGRPARHARRLLAQGGLYADLYRTQFGT